LIDGAGFVVALLTGCHTQAVWTPPGDGWIAPDQPIPEQCRDLGLGSPPKPLPYLTIDTTGWSAYTGRYRLILFAPKDSRRSYRALERSMDFELRPVPPPPDNPYIPQVVGEGFLYGDLVGLSIGRLSAPVDQGQGSGFPFVLQRTVQEGSVVWGVASLGLDSGIGFHLARLESGRMTGWWFDGAAWRYGFFCAIPEFRNPRA
jgi:hypothetical protein